MKRIGMLVAVDREMLSVFERFGEAGEKVSYPGFEVLTYRNDTYVLYIVRSGAGEIAAAAATQFLISVIHVDMVLNFGVVGGLTEEMARAKLCVVEKVVHYDFDTSPIDRTRVGQYLELPDEFIPVDRELLDTVSALRPDLKHVVCASGDKFVADPAKKAALHEMFGADICEMEAAAIALTCYRCEMPCLLMKAVSDGLTDGTTDFAEGLRIAATLALETLDELIREL